MPARVPLDVDLEDRLVYGLTPTRLAYVVISLLGLFVIGVSFIRGLAVGASLAVLFVMAAAVTLLPAVLGFVGWTRRETTNVATSSGVTRAVT